MKFRLSRKSGSPSPAAPSPAGSTARVAADPGARARWLLALLLAGLALWLLWGAWNQWQDGQRKQALVQARDQVAATVQARLEADRKKLGDWLASPPSVPADVLTVRLQQDWPEVQAGETLPADLAPLYADPAASGFGRLAMAEAALASEAAVARVIAIDGTPRLAVAGKVSGSGDPPRVLLALLPVQRLNAVLDEVPVPARGYLALRQGGHTVAERGESGWAQRAEAFSRRIEGSDLRVAAGLPEPAHGAFGLGVLPSLLAAGLLALFAVWLVASALGLRLPQRKGADGQPARGGAEPTLAEALVLDPIPASAPAVAAPAPQPAMAEGVVLDRGIFRAYDIRGVVGENLDRGVAVSIGRAIGSVMAEQDLKDIVVGRDGRLSGPDLVDGLIEGLRETGRNVIDLGMVPTPVVYFGTYHLRTGCGVAVTGSHNPPDYNGFKIVVGGITLAGDAITDLYARIAEGRLVRGGERGSFSQIDIGEDYVQRIAGDVQTARTLKVVVDAGNGVAGELGPAVLQAIGADVTPLYCEIDGEFPNHHPDPSDPHNLEDLVQMVQRLDADLGIAFDGDGDRLGVVTRSGENIFPDRLLMLFAQDVLERNPGAMVIYDVKCSGRLAGHILRHGGSPLMWNTGHSLVKAKMRETDAELAGEMSGHFFFGERWYGFDDGIYAAARLLEILSQRDEAPGEVLAALPNGVSTPEIKVAAPRGNPHAFVAAFQGRAHFEDARHTTIDGLRVDWDDGWGLVRASNTTPVLVMRFDADSAEALARIQAVFREQLLALDPELDLPF